jgi:iron complex outermembrane receptor protein
MPPRLSSPRTGALPRALLAAPLAALTLPALGDAASAQETSYELPVISINAGQDGSLTVQSYRQAQQAIDLTPGGVEVVPDTQWRDTPATTIKDMLDYVPGVFAQPKWGEDTRLSIRGSGISRNSHLRGIQLYQNGIPLSSADGGGDFQEIDPTAFQYVEVFKGANGYQYGANALGGAYFESAREPSF